MRKDSEALMAQIEQGITALGERFKTKEVMKLMRAKDKDERAKMEAIKSEADAIPAVLANAKSAYDGQKYKTALSMAKDAASKLQSVNGQLDAIVPASEVVQRSSSDLDQTQNCWLSVAAGNGWVGRLRTGAPPTIRPRVGLQTSGNERISRKSGPRDCGWPSRLWRS